MKWSRGFDEGGSAERDSREWVERWNVLEYDPPVGEPAWYGLLGNRPDLAPGAAHPTVLFAYVTNFEPERIVNGSDSWEVEVTYRIASEDRKQDYTLPPTQRPAIITATHESVEVPTAKKQNGDPWINTAGDLIAGHTRTENHWIFSVEKNVANVPTWFLEYADAVNDDAVVIKGLAVDQYHLLLKEPKIPMNPSYETVNDVEYQFYPISFSLVYNPRTWETKLYNRGLYEIDPTEGYRRITDDEGEPVDEPQFLDAAGAKLPHPVDPEDIVEIAGWDHALLPFNALPLT